MKALFFKSVSLCLVMGMSSEIFAVPPLDHIKINDPRIFNLSDNGTGYQLTDNPHASLSINLIHGPKGTVTGTATLSDDALRTWGPLPFKGKLSVSNGSPLTLKMSGGTGSTAKIYVTGEYDPVLKIFNVRIKAHTNENLQFKWNDSFFPHDALNAGILLSRNSVTHNQNNIIKGPYSYQMPADPVSSNNVVDKECPNSFFKVTGKGANIYGSYNPILDSYNITGCKINCGYGNINTAGSLVSITSDNLFPRIP